LSKWLLLLRAPALHAVLVSALVGVMGLRAGNGQTDISFDDSIPQNKVHGSCTQLSDYRQETGVTAADGSHPRFSGWTTAKFAYSPWEFTNQQRTKQAGFYCGCNKVTYPNINVCNTECDRAGAGTLACFNGNVICKGPPPGFCLTANVQVTFRTARQFPRSYRLLWIPDFQPSPTCSSEIAKWQTAIANHEQHHVDDALTIVNKTNTEWRSKKFTACGSVETEVVKDLSAQINAALRDQIAAMEKDYIDLGKQFHNTPAGAPAPDPSCDVCPEKP